MCEYEKPVKVFMFWQGVSDEAQDIKIILELEGFDVVLIDHEVNFSQLFAGPPKLKIIMIDDALSYLDKLITHLNDFSYDNILTVSDSYDSVKMKFQHFRYYSYFPQVIRPLDAEDLLMAISGCLPRCQ